MGKSGNPAKRAEIDHRAEVEKMRDDAHAVVEKYDPTPVDADGVEDFDAFWQQTERVRPTVRIMGELVELPPAMPLQAELLMKRLGRRSDDKSVRSIIAAMYGQDRLDQWAEGGMDGEQFQVLLAWTVQKLNGGTKSMAEVRAIIREAEGAGEA